MIPFRSTFIRACFDEGLYHCNCIKMWMRAVCIRFLQRQDFSSPSASRFVLLAQGLMMKKNAVALSAVNPNWRFIWLYDHPSSAVCFSNPLLSALSWRIKEKRNARWNLIRCLFKNHETLRRWRNKNEQLDERLSFEWYEPESSFKRFWKVFSLVNILDILVSNLWLRISKFVMNVVII